LTAERAGAAGRGHWGIENRLHWVRDVIFNDDQSRLRKGFGARNMAVVRHFARNLVRAAKDTKSIKLRRKMAAWTTHYLDAPCVSTSSEIWIRGPDAALAGLAWPVHCCRLIQSHLCEHKPGET
jgi:hypothetical protein